MTFQEALAVYIKFYFVLTPFFILAVFLALTETTPPRVQRALAGRVTLGVVLITIVLFLFGDQIFDLFGITADSFRIGAGALLFLSAISLTEGKFSLPNNDKSLMDLAIVPLAIPITIGPGTVGALIITAAEAETLEAKAITLASVLLAGLTVGVMLYVADKIKLVLGKSGISMLSKITGLILAALSCQMMFTGIASFLK